MYRKKEGTQKLISLCSSHIALLINQLISQIKNFNCIKVTNQSESKWIQRFKTTTLCVLAQTISKTSISYAQNKRALCAAWFAKCHDSSVLTVSHSTENKLLVAPQTNIRIIDTKMAAGTDHYLGVIKLLHLCVACQQLSNYFANWQELFMRHNVNLGWWSYRSTSRQSWKRLNPFTQFGRTATEN